MTRGESSELSLAITQVARSWLSSVMLWEAVSGKHPWPRMPRLRRCSRTSTTTTARRPPAARCCRSLVHAVQCADVVRVQSHPHLALQLLPGRTRVFDSTKHSRRHPSLLPRNCHTKCSQKPRPRRLFVNGRWGRVSAPLAQSSARLLDMQRHRDRVALRSAADLESRKLASLARD